MEVVGTRTFKQKVKDGLLDAKRKTIDDSEHLEKVYNDAIEAFKKYRGDDEE